MSKVLENGIVASTKCEKVAVLVSLANMANFQLPSFHPNLQQVSTPEQIDLLVAFVHHVRSGSVSTRKPQVHTQTVQVAL